MRCLTRMRLGLVGLALVTPPTAFADPPSSYLPDVGYPPSGRSAFDGMRLCANCQRSELQARGIAVPPPPPQQVEGMVPTNERCDRCGGAVTMVAASPAAAARMAASARPANAYNHVPPSAPMEAPVLASSPPIVPGPSSGPAWASVPASTSSLTVASLVPPTATPALTPPPGPGMAPPPSPELLATTQPRPKRNWIRPTPAPPPVSAPYASPSMALAPVPGPASGAVSVPLAPSSLAMAPIPAPGPALPGSPMAERAAAPARTRTRASAPSMMASTPSSARPCPTCEPSATMVAAGGDTAGHAVAGGGVPGYAVIGGTIPLAEPAPIGVVQGRYAYQDQGPAVGGEMPKPPVVAAAPRAKPRGQASSDPAVMPSNYSSEPYDNVGHNRPHILTHVFGLDAIGRRGREDRERRSREKHASIPYRAQSEPAVGDLPAKMVYGR